jgi:3D (Asp-Asp-Asp) domain-containing protein
MIAKLLLLGVLQVTSYRPIPAQTKPECRDSDHCRTSIDDTPTMFGVAVSQDLLKSGKVHYGDILYIEGYGYRVVNDCMNARIHNAIDLLVFTKAQEKCIGIRHKNVYIASQPIELPKGN